MNVLMHDLFFTDVGILSMITIAVIIGMAAYIGFYVARHVKEDEAKARLSEARRRDEGG